jgi:phosphoketolase
MTTGANTACAPGDGAAEPGALATARRSNDLSNPVRNGAVLPILSLDGRT